MFGRRARVTVLVLAAAVVLYGCGGDGGDTPATVASWDEFLERDDAAATGRQVVVVGIDAGVWHVIDRLIDEGRLPNFARIKREGASGPLMSVPAYVTPPAWTAMFTGYLPEKTGVYAFGYWDREAHEFVSANSDDIEVPTVWEAASRAGLRTGIFNVPMTWPPRPVNGAMVTGQMTPIEAFNPPVVESAFRLAPKYADYFPQPRNSFAPPGTGVLLDPLNVYLATIYDGTRDGVQKLDSVYVRVIPRGGDLAAGVETRSEGRCALGEFSPWLKIRHVVDGDEVDGYVRIRISVDNRQASTELSPVILPIEATFTHPPELAARLDEQFGFYLPTKFLPVEVVQSATRDMTGYASWFYDYDDWDLYCFVFTQTDNIQHLAGYTEPTARVYEEVDRFLGELMNRLPAGATLMVVSDHGSREHTFGIDLNLLLSELSLLEFESPGHIDYDRTVVFHNLWYLYFNEDLLTRDELLKRGFNVPEGADARRWLYDFFRETKVRTADGSRAFIVNASPLPETAVGHAPDMAVSAEYEDYMVAYWNIMNPGTQVIRELEGTERFWHSRDGVVMLWGDGVRKGVDAGARDIQDVGPTILYLLGLPVGPDMDGEVMRDLFTDRVTAGHPVVVNEGYRDIPREVVLPDADRESLRKKLRSLGYVQ